MSDLFSLPTSETIRESLNESSLVCMLQVRAKDGPPLPLVSCARRLIAHATLALLCSAQCGRRVSSCPRFARLQGQQLRGLLQLQVLHPLPGLLAGVLPIYRRHRAAVLHQILDSECCRASRHVVDGIAEDADWAVD